METLPGSVKARPYAGFHWSTGETTRELNAFLEEIRARVERTVAQPPPHVDYVTRYCQVDGKPMPEKTLL